MPVFRLPVLRLTVPSFFRWPLSTAGALGCEARQLRCRGVGFRLTDLYCDRQRDHVGLLGQGSLGQGSLGRACLRNHVASWQKSAPDCRRLGLAWLAEMTRLVANFCGNFDRPRHGRLCLHGTRDAGLLADTHIEARLAGNLRGQPTRHLGFRRGHFDLNCFRIHQRRPIDKWHADRARRDHGLLKTRHQVSWHHTFEIDWRRLGFMAREQRPHLGSPLPQPTA